MGRGFMETTMTKAIAGAVIAATMLFATVANAGCPAGTRYVCTPYGGKMMCGCQ